MNYSQCLKASVLHNIDHAGCSEALVKDAQTTTSVIAVGNYITLITEGKDFRSMSGIYIYSS